MISELTVAVLRQRSWRRRVLTTPTAVYSVVRKRCHCRTEKEQERKSIKVLTCTAPAKSMNENHRMNACDNELSQIVLNLAIVA